MKASAFPISLALLLLISPARGQQTSTALPLSETDYDAYAEKLIDKIRQDKPEIARRADELYKRLPAIVGQLEQEARMTGSRAENPSLNTGSPELVTEMERWIGLKGTTIDTELRFAVGRLKAVQRAVQPVEALIKERQRKQQIIANVIMLIKDFLQGRDRDFEDPEVDRNKSDRVGPSASNGAPVHSLQTPPGTAALSME
jgi:hypothetical protein